MTWIEKTGSSHWWSIQVAIEENVVAKSFSNLLIEKPMKFYLSHGNKTLYEIPLYWFVHEQQIAVKIPSKQTSPYPTKRHNRKISSSSNFVPSKKGTRHCHIWFPRRVKFALLKYVWIHWSLGLHKNTRGQISTEEDFFHAKSVATSGQSYLPQRWTSWTNISPDTWWLEDEVSFLTWSLFRGLVSIFRWEYRKMAWN